MGSVLVNTTPVAIPQANAVAQTDTSSMKVEVALGQARKLYTQRLPKSKAQHEAATEFLPGGNTRSVLHTDPFPICMKRGLGNRLWDLDDHE